MSRIKWTSPECESRIACDGNKLRGDRVSLGICATCEKKQKERGRMIEPRGLKLEGR